MRIPVSLFPVSLFESRQFLHRCLYFGKQNRFKGFLVRFFAGTGSKDDLSRDLELFLEECNLETTQSAIDGDGKELGIPYLWLISRQSCL
jgi:hypothetical protein